MILTKKALHRRTFLRGAGVTLALPFLDAMVPALGAAAVSKRPLRVSCIYVPQGVTQADWMPKGLGKDFTFSPILKPLESFREYLLILDGLDNRPADAEGDGAGDHARAGTAWLSGVHPPAAEGANIRAATTVDQLIAEQIGKTTPMPSLELTLEQTGLAGKCEPGYTCAFENTISWKNPTTPLPMEINPRTVYERLFGEGGSADRRAASQRADASLLDFVMEQLGDLKRTVGSSDRVRLDGYVDSVREIERRIQLSEKAKAADPESSVDLPLGVPDSFEEHAKLMLDLQVVAFQADVTRVSTLMISKETSSRPYPQAGVKEGHHALSHHGGDPAKLALQTKINTYHVQLIAHFLEKMRAVEDGDGTLLDHAMLLYGSGMGDGNVHGHVHLPILLAGGAGGRLKGGRHLAYEEGTPIANLLVSMAEISGVPTDHIGNSRGELAHLTDL